jgi:hypothetical protein
VAANEQHRRDRDCRDRRNDEAGPEEAHDLRTVPLPVDPGLAWITVAS